MDLSDLPGLPALAIFLRESSRVCRLIPRVVPRETAVRWLAWLCCVVDNSVMNLVPIFKKK
jgi:hypothetical protein